MRKARQFLSQDEKTVKFYQTEYRISEIAARVLYNRVGDNKNEADVFFSASPFEFFNPFLIDGMEAAVNRLKAAIEAKEKVVIYGDYDVDGITSVSLMVKYLTSKGLSPDYYIPERTGEGYGLNLAALSKIKEQGASLVITVDNGITAVSEIEEGMNFGLDFIITDHHECNNALPKASAVINPKLSPNYPFRELAGVGVAFKLICGVEGEGSEKRILEQYGDIIAIGTIADVVPLLSENREIAKAGLKKINRGEASLGISALISLLNKKQRDITSQSIGYMLSPRINAAGRMGSTENAVALFMAKTPEEALKYANILCEENDLRRSTEAKIMEEAEAALKTQIDFENERVIVLSGSSWHHGVIGIIASRLTDRYYLPSVLISVEEDGKSKGSGRSIPGFNLFEAFAESKELLEKYGGHELAAGLSLSAENIPLFKKAINEYAKKVITPEMLVGKITADCEIKLSDVNLALCHELSRFEPSGTSNLPPVFMFKNLLVKSVTPITERKFSRLVLSDGANEIFAMVFDKPYDSVLCKAGDRIDVMASVSENRFKDKVTAQLIVKDIFLLNEISEPLPENVGEADVPSVEELRDVFRYFKARAKENCVILGRNSLAEHISSERGIALTENKALLGVKIFNELNIIKTSHNEQALVLNDINVNGSVLLGNSQTYRILKEKGGNSDA